MTDRSLNEQREFRDVILEQTVIRGSEFSEELRNIIRAAPSIDATAAARWFLEAAADEQLDARALPNVYPWFSIPIFFEADVLGIEMPQAFLTNDGSVDWIMDMKLTRVGYVVEPISPYHLPARTLPEPKESVAACLQIAAFTEPGKGPVVGPQIIWTVPVGFDGRIAESNIGSPIQATPVAVPGAKPPSEEGLEHMAMASVPLLATCLFIVMCGSTLTTGYSHLKPTDDARADGYPLYVLDTKQLEEVLDQELLSCQEGVADALHRRTDIFPHGMPSPPD